jgi:hypothetical protein
MFKLHPTLAAQVPERDAHGTWLPLLERRSAMRILGFWLALGCLALPAHALELVINGGFEQAFTTGWQQETVGSAWYIDRATNYDPDPDYEAFVRHYTGSGSARLYQDVVIPSTNVEFAVRARILATATSPAWAGAAVVLSYLDQHGFLLGETYIGVKSATCPWNDGPTLHVIAAAYDVWMDYGFNVADELNHLPGVDPAAVHKIRISLYVRAADC